jgi:hypothetical protein
MEPIELIFENCCLACRETRSQTVSRRDFGGDWSDFCERHFTLTTARKCAYNGTNCGCGQAIVTRLAGATFSGDGTCINVSPLSEFTTVQHTLPIPANQRAVWCNIAE